MKPASSNGLIAGGVARARGQLILAVGDAVELHVKL